jgi:endonuclease/exonuclease/phosphatase family metal-dependent hydrolase
LQRLWVHLTPAARAASDHIPVVADIRLPDAR